MGHIPGGVVNKVAGDSAKRAEAVRVTNGGRARQVPAGTWGGHDLLSSHIPDTLGCFKNQGYPKTFWPGLLHLP